MKKNLQFELNEDYHKELKTLADNEFRTLKSTVEMIVMKYLDNLRKTH